MKKAATWIAVLSGVIAAIAMLAMGIGVYRMDEYIVLSCLALLYIAALVLRFSPSNCPYCGRHIPANAAYCPYCGKEIHREVK